MTYLVSYDIRTPGRDYTVLLNTLASFENSRRMLRSVWLLESSLSTTVIHDHLSQFVDSNDRLLVCQILNFNVANPISAN